jgi:hypothetical protein
MRRVDSATGPDGSATDVAAFHEVKARLGQAFFTEKTRYPPNDLFGPLLHAPRVALGILELGGALRSLGEPGADTNASLPEDFVEFVACVVFAQMCEEALARGSAFAYRRPMFNHLPRALKAGVRSEAIQALRRHDDTMLLPRERELAEFVRAVLAGGVDDHGWARMQERLGARRTIETASYALLGFFVCRLEAALGLRDATDAELDALVADSARDHPGSRDLSL